MALGQEDLGARIKQAREEAGLSQAGLAERIGLKHPQSVSNYERGLTEVTTARLSRIADATRRPLSFFLEEPQEAPQPAQGWGEVLARIAELEAREQRQQELLLELLSLVRGAQGRPGASGT